MSWAGPDRALPPEMIPQNLFDRLFGVRDEGWIDRKKSVLDAVREDLGDLQPTLGQSDRHRLDEHLTSVRDLERAIASLPSDYGRNIKEPEDIADLTDYPRIAKIQSDLVGACAGVGADQRRVLHALEGPEPHALPVDGPAPDCGITTTRTTTRPRPNRSGSCAISAAGTSKSSPTS